MPDYMLLLHERPENFENLSPEEMQGIISRYMSWRTNQSTRVVGGNKLRDDAGRVIERGKARAEVRDGPFTESKEVVSGYFIVSASDYDDAVRIASGCPHLELGGRIEVREIEPT